MGRHVGVHVVDHKLPTPLYHQIYVYLRDRIYDGTYACDAFLPGEQELVRLFGVSRITARRALDELAAAGLVVRERGRGTRVSYLAPSPPVRSSVEGLLENLLAMGLKTEVRLLEFDYVPATEEVAIALQCEPGDPVQRAVRVRLLEGEPFSYLVTHVPAEIGRGYGREDLAVTPLLALLERGGVKVGRAEQTLTATLATPEVVPLLEVDAGGPLLKVTRTVYDQGGAPVEHIVALYRPDRYQYRMVLERVEGETHNTWSPANWSGEQESMKCSA